MSINPTLAAGLFGYSAIATGSDPATAIGMLKRATAAGAAEKGIARERRDPVIITALAQFDKALGAAKDLKSALADPRIMAVLLPAVGLGSQLGNPGLAQRALLADPEAKGGLLVRIDQRWKKAAQMLGVFGKDISALRDPALLKTLKDNYVGYQYQKSLDARQPGMSDALYFISQAAGKSDNVYNVLGDAILRRVVTGALGLPRELAVQSVERQASAVTTRMPLTRLNDPEQVYKLAQRYLMTAASNATANAAPDLAMLAMSLRA